MAYIKKMNEVEFIEYRNLMIKRRDARLRNFPKSSPDELNYYEIRLREMNEMYPEYAKLGIIRLKGNIK